MKAKRIIRAAGVAVLLVSASGASAEGDGETMKSLLGAIGIIPRERPPIEYRERAPLVVPPKLELRAPLDPNAAQARAANWPQDPEVAARRRDAAEARKLLSNNSRLTPDEIQAGRRAGAASASDAEARATREGDFSRMTPDQLRAQDPRNRAKPVLAGIEPERRTLTEPPTGYRKPAANAPVRATADAPEEADPDSPSAFQRELERRR
jgi:hypothetical protein